MLLQGGKTQALVWGWLQGSALPKPCVGLAAAARLSQSQWCPGQLPAARLCLPWGLQLSKGPRALLGTISSGTFQQQQRVNRDSVCWGCTDKNCSSPRLLWWEGDGELKRAEKSLGCCSADPRRVEQFHISAASLVQDASSQSKLCSSFLSPFFSPTLPPLSFSKPRQHVSCSPARALPAKRELSLVNPAPD